MKTAGQIEVSKRRERQWQIDLISSNLLKLIHRILKAFLSILSHLFKDSMIFEESLKSSPPRRLYPEVVSVHAFQMEIVAVHTPFDVQSTY